MDPGARGGIAKTSARARRARVGRVALALGVLALVGGAAELHRRHQRQHAFATCTDRGNAIGDVWNPGARARVRDAVLGSGVSHASTTAAHVLPRLDAHALAWARATRSACLDATVRHPEGWTDDLHDRARWCLAQRRLELSALVNELASAKGRSVTEGVQAAAALAPMTACRDRDALVLAPAPAPHQREAALGVAASLARARVLGLVGARDEALPLASRTLADAEDLGFAPLRAAVRTRIGRLLEEIGEPEEAEVVLEHAYLEALAAGDLATAVDAADGLAAAVGHRQGRRADGLHWFRRAAALRATLPDPTGSSAAAGLDTLAAIHRTAGDRSRALAVLEGALALRERSTDDPRWARTLDALGTLHLERGDRDDARAAFERSLASREETLAPDHAQVSLALDRLQELEQPRTYEVPYALPWLERPEIILSLATRTIHLFDRSTGFSATYPAAPGVLDEHGHSVTPTGFFTTAGDLEDPWYFMERRYLLDWFGGFPFLRLTAESDTGQHTIGLHGPITYTCDDGGQSCGLLERRWYLENGYVSHGCVRMEADDAIELFWSVREHPRVPVAILPEAERDADGRIVEVGSAAALWREGDAIDYGACGSRPDPWQSTFRWEDDAC